MTIMTAEEEYVFERELKDRRSDLNCQSVWDHMISTVFWKNRRMQLEGSKDALRII